MLAADRRLLLMAFGGMLQAMLALVRQTTPAEIRCDVESRGSVATVEFSQDHVRTPGPLLTRFFDETYHGRSGGYGAAVALGAAKREVELHGGTATVEAVKPLGCRVIVQLPAGVSER